jgi:polyisoprenoid-binding protein YceI
MKMKLIALLSTLLAGLAFGGNWNVDASKAKVQFSVKGPFGTVHGNFSDLKATIQFNEKDLPGSSISASIGAETVSTGIGLRNSDLRKKEEWLNAPKFPLVSFRSRKIQKTDAGYMAHGDLTLKGITKPVEIPFTFTGNGSTGLFKGQFLIKRQDFNIGKPGGSVGEEITINLEVPVAK